MAWRPAEATRTAEPSSALRRASAMGLRQWFPSQSTRIVRTVGLEIKWVGSGKQLGHGLKEGHDGRVHHRFLK
jgi:hypothetical protein